MKWYSVDEKAEYTILPGTHIWKSHAEYSTRPVLTGTPYYQITKDEGDGTYYFWELETTTEKYHLRKSGTDFNELWEEGLRLDRKIGEERWAASPDRLR